MYAKAYVEITNCCNLRCSFCHGHSRPARQLSREEFAHILQQLQGKTKYIYYHLMGEPLLHPLLPNFLEMAADADFRSVITTNATLLEEKKAVLLACPIHKMNLSLHSFENRDLPGCQSYMQQVADFALEAARRGILICMRLWNNGFDGEKNQVALQVLQQVFPEPWQENSRGFRLRDKVYLEWGDRFAWPDQEAEVVSQRVFCYGLKDQFGILSDGTVVPCCLDSDGGIALGNVFRQPLEEILNSPRAKAMVEGFRCRTPSEELCRRCGYAARF